MNNVSNLPEPSFIDRDVQAVTAEIIAKYEQLSGKTLYPAQADRIFVDVIAYREMLIRNSIQEAAKQNLLAFARAPVLDYIGDLMGVYRLEGETDDQLRQRIRLAPETYSTAGCRLAYTFHALSANADIIDAAPVRADSMDAGIEGDIHIYVLTKSGVVSQTILDQVEASCNAITRRPISDDVTAYAGVKKDYALNVTVTPYDTADSAKVAAAVRAAADNYVAAKRTKLGLDIDPSQIIDALFVDGVYKIDVNTPANTLVIHESAWANCTGITVNLATPNKG